MRVFEHSPRRPARVRRTRDAAPRWSSAPPTAGSPPPGWCWPPTPSPSPVRRLRKYIVPVYDYVLMTEPLDPAQRAAIGWDRRQGIGSTGNQFLYFRQTADHRILFGGYDAVYHYGSAMGPPSSSGRPRSPCCRALFAETFPQLEDVRFTHSWSGAIDTCSRFCAFFDRSHDGRVASVAGYTGLGVGASRFGARVALDLVSGAETELTRLRFVRRKPIPFPPEPVRSIGISLTRWSHGPGRRPPGEAEPVAAGARPGGARASTPDPGGLLGCRLACAGMVDPRVPPPASLSVKDATGTVCRPWWARVRRGGARGDDRRRCRGNQERGHPGRGSMLPLQHEVRAGGPRRCRGGKAGRP